MSMVIRRLPSETLSGVGWVQLMMFQDLPHSEPFMTMLSRRWVWNWISAFWFSGQTGPSSHRPQIWNRTILWRLKGRDIGVPSAAMRHRHASPSSV